ncbi:hypothetical protein M8C13_32430 [Crossiella sp. SN42]|uniref:hypothetical protein n=1 Tax=Crossiella sp. SN42 TaxID=2944808 RepID=UPI00207C1C26|nr:hypothetical protein [Crossiella sp. SN42]MCO1580471.1 hypothetical protein [Crossiella sp. SN42]
MVLLGEHRGHVADVFDFGPADLAAGGGSGGVFVERLYRVVEGETGEAAGQDSQEGLPLHVITNIRRSGVCSHGRFGPPWSLETELGTGRGTEHDPQRPLVVPVGPLDDAALELADVVRAHRTALTGVVFHLVVDPLGEFRLRQPGLFACRHQKFVHIPGTVSVRS